MGCMRCIEPHLIGHGPKCITQLAASLSSSWWLRNIGYVGASKTFVSGAAYSDRKKEWPTLDGSYTKGKRGSGGSSCSLSRFIIHGDVFFFVFPV